MAITKIALNNITVFKHLELNLNKGINLFIGDNGTGKTHLLKMLYLTYQRKTITRSREILDEKYIRQYDDNRQCKSNVVVWYDLDGREETCWIQEDAEKLCCSSNEMVYIPVNEMLSHSKGLLALSRKYKLPYDKTEIDIISNAELPETLEVSSLEQTILDQIGAIIGGEVIYEDDTFYIKKTNGIKIEFSLESEGMRKIGLLWKLIKNGLICKNSILLWDEPEANLNPSLIPTLVGIMLELQRAGIQIFIATHSYNLAKYFEVKRAAIDNVLFHNLVKKDTEAVVESKEYFGELKGNKIIQADEDLLDMVFEKNLED